jgi:hypothetical protein
MTRLRFLGVLLSTSLLASSLLACGDDDPIITPDAAPDAPDSPDPMDPARYTAPAGEELAFGVQEGNIRNYFYRNGPVAVHLLTRSGESPRVVAAFPAGNQGIGIWFQDVDGGADLAVTGDIATGGDVAGVIREQPEDPRRLHGVRATLTSDASNLQVKLHLLANVRTVRDYGYGFDFSTAPELTNNDIEIVAAHNVVRVSRVQVGGDYHMEYLIKGLDDTQISVFDGTISMTASAGIRFDLIVLSDEEPLTPIDKSALLTNAPADSFELKALAFLTYAEKLQAGSWRFLTYFGRDTLLSVRMLMSALEPEVIEAALSSVIERINLMPGLVDPVWDFTIDVGDVAHEEELADFAAWKNSKDDPAPASLRTPRFDYKMVDDDFLLAPVLARYMQGYPERATEFLTRTRELDGASYRDAIESNLELVMSRAAPYADPADPQNPLNLIALRDSVPVGEWRDSDQGLGFGRYAFNVNAALVPAALAGARDMYTQFAEPEKVTEAETLIAAWTDIEEHFLISLPQAEAQDLVTGYADSIALDSAVAGEIAEDLEYYAISLDQSGDQVPVMHTDHGFVMLFTDPSETYLQRIARSITRTFPAGLFSDVGVMVANPAFAGDIMVTNPLDQGSPAVKLTDIFTNSHYHGTVVWSWQQAMLAAGVRRQLKERSDLSGPTVAALEDAECKLWQTINKANEVRAGELWTWVAETDRPEYRPFGYNRNDVDESNAAQLWSTVYLAVKPPDDFETRCAAALARRR